MSAPNTDTPCDSDVELLAREIVAAMESRVSARQVLYKFIGSLIAARNPAPRPGHVELVAKLIHQLWLETRPSREAQQIRAEVSKAFDDEGLATWAADYLPEELWGVVDIAVQRALDTRDAALREALTLPPLDGEWDYKGDDPAWRMLYRWGDKYSDRVPEVARLFLRSDGILHSLAKEINVSLREKDAEIERLAAVERARHE